MNGCGGKESREALREIRDLRTILEQAFRQDFDDLDEEALVSALEPSIQILLGRWMPFKALCASA